jgi:hypothetical protein
VKWQRFKHRKTKKKPKALGNTSKKERSEKQTKSYVALFLTVSTNVQEENTNKCFTSKE